MRHQAPRYCWDRRRRRAEGLTLLHKPVRPAKLRSLFVISLASTSALEARGMGADAAARVLDVDYVASGMLRRVRGHIALSAQLIHTRSGRVIWADNLRAREAEPFDVLDELCNQLVAAIADQVELALPVIGLRGLWALPRNFWIDLSAQYFALEIDEYDGSLVNLRAIVLWQPSQWLGIGLGYDRFAVDLNVAKDRFDGSLDWTYQGPMIFYSATF